MKRKHLLILFAFILGCGPSAYFKEGYLLPANSEPVEIPFTIEKGLIILNAEINGMPGRFLFDNGFSLSALDPEFAKKITLNFEGNSTITDANSKSQRIRRTVVDSVEIGNQKFIGTGFYEIETSNFWSCTELDGIIGASIINKANWNINFRDSLLMISSTPFAVEAFEFDFTISNNNSSITEIEIENKTFETKIDFGKSGEMDLEYDRSKSLFENDSVEVLKGIMSLSATGLGNSEETYRLKERQSFIVNGNTLPTSTEIELTHDLKYQAYLGAGYFRNYQVIINSTDRKYILVEQKQPEKIDDYSYGLSIYPVNDEWKIIRKNPYDPDLDSLELMDIVIELGGLPISRFKDICSLRSYLSEKSRKMEPIHIKTSGNEISIPFNRTTLSINTTSRE